MAAILRRSGWAAVSEGLDRSLCRDARIQLRLQAPQRLAEAKRQSPARWALKNPTVVHSRTGARSTFQHWQRAARSELRIPTDPEEICMNTFTTALISACLALGPSASVAQDAMKK